MNSSLLLTCLVSIVAYMTIWFGVSFWRKKLSIVDVAWGGGFALLAWLAVWQEPSSRSALIALLVTVWALRITLHLGRRVFRSKHDDPRYEKISAKWKGNLWLRAYFSIFLLQGLLVVTIGLPIIVATGEQYADLAILSVVGAVIWAIGFGIEAAADRQLRDFLAYKPNRGTVMRLGLWRYSRHPNYFGELVQWWGIGVIALQVQYGYVGLLGPALLTYLILFVSGVPPIENAKKDDKAYQDYKRRTSMLIPLPPKKA